MKHPGAPEPWPEGIEVVVLPGPGRYVEGSFAPGGAGLISALEERSIAAAAFGDPRHAYSHADLGWYGPTIVYPTGARCDGTIAILTDAVITAIRSRSSRGNETTRTHLSVDTRATTAPRLSGWISEVLQRISTQRWDAGLIARVSRHGRIATG